ncbi:MAG TPA: tripartite tricarboxylate transporter substrate-binding protein [Methylomirabilota bacterium]|nr:tripartite tricarboxylate transporter substrate-binding protein [Methylomirabilota bacterium]
MRSARPISFALLALALCLATPARAEDVAAFYRGRQVSWILSADAGGGYAAYARAFASYFGDHIPGKPSIVIQHMPGGGGLRAMSWLAAVAPRDGSTIGLVHSSVPFAPLYGIRGAAFDPRQMGWIGSIATSRGICVAWHTAGIASWQDMLTKEFIVGGSGAGSQMETLPVLLNRLFGTRIKVISGYKGGNAIYLAMERGEVQGRCGGLVSSINATRPDWFASHKVTVPIQVAITRNVQFPDVPAIVELARDARTRDILRLALAAEDMDRPILAPPSVPPERIAALREAFHAAMTDPGFIADAKRQRLEIDEVAGERVAAIIAETFALPPDVVKAANDAMHLTGSQGSD